MRILRGLVLGIAALGAATYAVDYLSIHLDVPARPQFGSVVVEKHFAVKLKDNKSELMFAPPAPVQCSNSLFPQLGANPCWYLGRHRVQEIQMDGGLPEYLAKP
jgi:hypothetical protein